MKSILLYRLWQQILKDTGNLNRLPAIIERHNKKAAMVNATEIKTTAEIMNDSNNKNMTLKTFVKLVFSLLPIIKMEFTVTLHWKESVLTKEAVTTHTVNMIGSDEQLYLNKKGEIKYGTEEEE